MNNMIYKHNDTTNKNYINKYEYIYKLYKYNETRRNVVTQMSYSQNSTNSLQTHHPAGWRHDNF